FLWRVRTAVHHHTSRLEDRLLFEHQRQLAMSFGYKGDGNVPVERFMKKYYRTVAEISRLNEVLLQHFQEAIIYYRFLERTTEINNRFQTRNNFIEVKNSKIFRKYPFALLEIFLLIQQNSKIKGVRASTIRLIRQHLNLIDDEFRNDLRNRALFMEIMRQPRWVGHQLRRMHRYGVLGMYLPVFEKIEGQMQFDLFHVYTVDEHTLFVVRFMRYFGLDDYRDRFPMCYRLIQAIPKREILYIAGLFHDIAKGRGGDHSELGAIDAYKFCIQHAMSEYDAKLVSWLVRHHLTMSVTAQQKDIEDINVINEFAEIVGNTRRLEYLYLLTVADINGTNPDLWNSWKDALLVNLYNKTLRALRRGLESPLNNQERVLDTKSNALRELENSGMESSVITGIWKHLNDDFFLRYSPDEVCWYTKKIAQVRNTEVPVVLLREKTERGGSEIFIYMKDQDNIFAATTRVLSKLRLNILDARIITSENNFVLDSYIVLEKNDKHISGTDRKTRVINSLVKALSDIEVYMAIPRSSKMDKKKVFPIQTRIWFSENAAKDRTIMEVTCLDQPGILSRIGEALHGCNARIHGAKVATFGERVDDLFFITDKDNRPIRDATMLDCLEQSITSKLRTGSHHKENDIATADRS
ncbi:MAG: [protein-PII] uridylyltransferase, partial [Thiotrichales bacterium]|nr:[protein-PII] uridylyltransferase [Thiotrichales bacterium]